MKNTYCTRKTNEQDKYTVKPITYPVASGPSIASIVIWSAFGMIVIAFVYAAVVLL